MTKAQSARARWLHFFREGDYAILLLLLMPILGVWGISSLLATIQLIGVALYSAVVFGWVKGPVFAKSCLWAGIALWFIGLIFAIVWLIFIVFV